MLIKHQDLSQQLNKGFQPIYILFGQDPYLLNSSAVQIKKYWRQMNACDEKTLDLLSPTEWAVLFEEANSYSLFAEHVLLDARWEKKTLDPTGKSLLTKYLPQANSRCLILIQAPHVPAKQWQWLANDKNVLLIQCSPLSPSLLLDWIKKNLQEAGITYEKQAPELIHQFTQGNMLASWQVIEKIKLTPSQKPLTLASLKEQLVDQSEFQPYELADACLQGNSSRAIHILRLASQNKTEPTLLLWILTQEIRLIIALYFLIDSASLDFTRACSQLKIWAQRQRYYKDVRSRLPLKHLYFLLKLCSQIDEQIKTSQEKTIWDNLEKLALFLCGKSALAL